MDVDLDLPKVGPQLKAPVSAARESGYGVYIRHAESIWVDLMVLGSISLRLE